MARDGEWVQQTIETSTRAGEDGEKVMEVLSCGGMMHSSLRGPLEHPRHVCGLHQHGQGMTDSSWELRKKASVVWGAAPCPGVISVIFLSEGEQRCGQPANATVAQVVKL